MTGMTSPSHLSPDHHPRVFAPSTPSSTYSSSTLPPSFTSSPSAAHSPGQSSATLSSSIRPSTKPLTSPSAAQPSTLSPLISRSASQSTAPTSANASTLPPVSAFTPICPASPRSTAKSSPHHLPSTPPSSVPPSPQVPERAPRMSCNQLSVSSSHNSLDGEVQVSDIYFVSAFNHLSVLLFFIFVC